MSRRPSNALVAALVGLVALPALVLAGVPTLGELAIGVAVITLGVAATAAVLGNRQPIGVVGGVLIAPAYGIGVAAHAYAERAIAAQILDSGLVGGVVLAAIVTAFAWVGALVAERAQQSRGARRIVIGIAGAMVGGAAALAILVIARGEAPDVDARVAAMTPTRSLGVLVDDVVQREELEEPGAGSVLVERSCSESFCELRVSVEHWAGHDRGFRLGSRRPLPDEIDRAPLEIVLLPRVVVVLPRAERGGLDCTRAMAFERATARATDVRALDLGVAVAPPMPWRIAAVVGLALAIAMLAFRARAARIRRMLARAVDAVADEDGVLRLADGTVARAASPVVRGPYVVLAVDRNLPGYRVEGLAVGRGLAEGTVAAHTRLVEERIAALDLSAIGVIAITHAPLIATWIAGYAVLGR